MVKGRREGKRKREDQKRKHTHLKKRQSRFLIVSKREMDGVDEIGTSYLMRCYG